MPNYFTNKGLELKRKKIKIQEEKTKKIGKEVGEEAGINCDWHDNFGFEDAKRRFDMESRILYDLMTEISEAQILEVEEQDEVIAIGVTVKLLMNEEEKTYTIGGFGESDINNNLISYNTPLAMNILRLENGDTTTVNMNGRQVKIEIEKIYPPSYRYNELLSKMTD